MPSHVESCACACSFLQPVCSSKHRPVHSTLHFAGCLWRNYERIISYKQPYTDKNLLFSCRYLRVHLRARRAAKRLGTDVGHELWQKQHATGSAAIRDMLVDLKGFYLKLGQILASKTDLLPVMYTQALSTLFDDMPHESRQRVSHALRRQFGKPVEKVLDCSPAKATTWCTFCVQWCAICFDGGESRGLSFTRQRRQPLAQCRSSRTLSGRPWRPPPLRKCTRRSSRMERPLL